MSMQQITEWGSALLIPAGLAFQVFRIYQHKEVRDLSLVTCIIFVVAYISLSIKAHDIDSSLFLLKNSLSLVFALILLVQRIYYKNSKWIDGPETPEEHMDKQLIEDVLILIGNKIYTEGEYTPMIRGILNHYQFYGKITSYQRNALITHFNNNSLDYRSVLT